MIKGFRLELQSGKERTSRTVKPVWEYTAGDIATKNVTWMTDKSPNADMLTREGDTFDKAFKSAKKIMTIAIPEKWMSISPFTKNQYIETLYIRWYSDQAQGVDDFWRQLVLHHVKIKRADLREARTSTMNGSYYEVVMQIDADIEYLDKYGTKAK